jgi:alpha-N-acetylglucosamine transferase
MSDKKIFPKTFLTGCDEKTEWQIPFFLKNFRKHKHTTKLIVADFGMSSRMIHTLEASEEVQAVMQMSNDVPERGWFYKPATMWHCPSIQTVWLDTDCIIQENIDDIFDLLKPGMLNMVEDKPWTKRRGEVWYNSGVVGFIHKPDVLKEWTAAVRRKQEVGDQEVLHSLLNPITQLKHINPLPNEYNVVRLQVENDGYKGKIKVMHWTGEKGNKRIRSMMNA